MELSEEVRLIMETAINDMITELGGDEEVFRTPLRHLLEKEFRSKMHEKMRLFMESQE